MSELLKATAMVPDSTQSGNGEKDHKRTKKKKKKQQQSQGKRKEGSDGNKEPTKKKKTTKKQSAQNKSCGGEEKNGDTISDLDLTKPLFPLGHFINDREEMLKQAFQSVSKEQLLAMIPDVLKDCPMEVLKAMCLGQLEGMSKKRIRHVLAGEEMLSSSDTDESGNELDDERMGDLPGETEDAGNQREIDQVQVEGNTDVVQDHEQGLGVVQEEEVMEELMEEHHEDLQGETEAEEEVHPIVKVEPLSDASPERSTGGQQSPAVYQEDQESEREYVTVNSPFGESRVAEMASFGEEQTAEQTLPVKRRKKRKKVGERKIIDPADLEEGEVEDGSSEYTDGSEEESDTDVKETDKPDEMDSNVSQRVGEGDADQVSGVEGDETGQEKMREGISRTENSVNNEGDKILKLGTTGTCANHGEQNSFKSEGASEEEPVVMSEEHSVMSEMSASKDALSMDKGSDLENEQEEADREETSHQSGEMQETLTVGEDLDNEGSNDSDASENSVEVDESELSSPQDGQSDQSDLIKSNTDKVVEATVKTENNVDKTKLTEPRLDVLELELRARAIRSLMKHCVNEKK